MLVAQLSAVDQFASHEITSMLLPGVDLRAYGATTSTITPDSERFLT